MMNAHSTVAESRSPYPASPATGGRGASAPFVPIAEGHQLFVRDWGSGTPVVLLAGWGMDSRCWGETMARLNRAGCRTIAYDRRGHGRSTDPGTCDYDLLADDLATVLDRLDIAGAVLVGHSGASGEIIRYLARHGSRRVARAVLVGGMGPRMIAAEPGAPGLSADLVEATIARIEVDLAGWIEENIEPFAPGADAVTRRWMEAMPLDTSRRTLVDFQRDILTTDLTEEARALPVPVTLIHGDLDASAPIALTARRYVELIPQARLVTYEGAAHGLMFTHADRLAADIRSEG
jgi:pimeloyl-ACP methyl ester carboxylesterase